jgi:hypothetical protein
MGTPREGGRPGRKNGPGSLPPPARLGKSATALLCAVSALLTDADGRA